MHTPMRKDFDYVYAATEGKLSRSVEEEWHTKLAKQGDWGGERDVGKGGDKVGEGDGGKAIIVKKSDGVKSAHLQQATLYMNSIVEKKGSYVERKPSKHSDEAV